jgi:MtfA peptidase
MSEYEAMLLVLGGLLAAGLLGSWGWHAARTRQRRRLVAEPFPPAWRTALAQTVPLYRRLPAVLRQQIEPAARAFLSRVEFVGCRGLPVTDEMRAVVAVQACLLTVARDPDAYAELHSVLLYPDEFVVQESEEDETGVVTEGSRVLSGQAFDTDRIVLSWTDVLGSGTDGYNVVLHEFAHYLDHSAGSALSQSDPRRLALQRWHAVLDREYRALCAAVDRGQETLIDPYGAEDPAEFVAVATEAFFECAPQLRTRHPALYRELREFYGLDPAAWGD